MRPVSLRTQVSSGGVIFRRNDGDVDVALISVKNGSIWCLPKGVINEGESPENTALREVSEETGLKGRILGKLGEITYWFHIRDENAKCKKTVHFYLMEYEGGDVADHDWEVDSASWFPIDEAVAKANYKGE
ncbi:MAG TPA: NUDIX hydrolase, partial [Thermodesulfovibrionales bacterium]|nr:NUDIX hydrolase [Thermodesulfovibrionales bacterium]